MIKWNIQRADTEFSWFIRTRDGKCKNPKCTSYITDIKGLDCSHFYSRTNLMTRFDPENCIALCRMCHTRWEHTKQDDYKDLMVNLLGEEKYIALKKRADDYSYKMVPYLSKDKAIQLCREYLSNQPIWQKKKNN